MKVGILTWYQAVNHGAVLQTYGSSEILKGLGADPVVLDYKWVISDETDAKKRLFRRIQNFSPERLLWFIHVKKLYVTKKNNFQKFIVNYLNVGKIYCEEKDLDAVCIGSDMVFDITEGYNSYMHGEGIPASYIFSYAASFGYSTIDSLTSSGHSADIKKNLSTLKAIGYRDQKTHDLCVKLGIDVPMTETIDPVLCYGFKKEIEEWDSGKWKNVEYILIYAYDSTMNDKETVFEIKKFAKERKLIIVSCGYYHKWCDICVPAAPDEFLEMFKYAKYVVTDTFHGTVFSLILHKQFVSIVRKNGFKVQYLLKCAGLENRISFSSETISNIASSIPDFAPFDQWVEKERNKSRLFIKNNLNEVGEIKT